MNLLPYFLIWSGLAMFVLGLALYRRLVSMHEDEFLHLAAGGEKLIGCSSFRFSNFWVRGASRVRKPLRLFFLPNDFQLGARAGPG